MSLIDNIRGKIAPASITALDVQRQLDAARREFSSLTEQRRQYALLVADGADDAQSKLDAIRRDLAEADTRVEDLEGALVAAKIRDDQRIRANQAQHHKTQIAKMRKAFDARDAAATDLVTALEKAATAWKALLAHSATAERSVPINATLPHGALTAPNELRDAVRLELARTLAVARTDGFPGSDFIESADLIAPLVPKLSAASSHTLAVLTGAK